MARTLAERTASLAHRLLCLQDHRRLRHSLAHGLTGRMHAVLASISAVAALCVLYWGYKHRSSSCTAQQSASPSIFSFFHYYTFTPMMHASTTSTPPMVSGRSMSWRKPVPRYLPSPPPSPRLPSRAAAAQLEQDLISIGEASTRSETPPVCSINMVYEATSLSAVTVATKLPGDYPSSRWPHFASFSAA
jgi:hypothetical protein